MSIQAELRVCRKKFMLDSCSKRIYKDIAKFDSQDQVKIFCGHQSLKVTEPCL